MTVTAPVHKYDVVVIGSGFGGSVAALRLTEKGYRVGVLEAGRRFADDELPKTSWDVRRFLWAPRLGCKGIQRIHPLRDVIVLAGAGVGGGSLVYGNTLYEPRSDAFYRDAQWADITDWRAELAPFYDQAKRMLGVVVNPTLTAVDEVYRTVAEEMGVGHTFTRTPVGVFFGRNGSKEPGVEVDDPFFGGVGPRRAGCKEDGECITGCRHNAKNTLVKNYLYLAEKAGATVHPETTATRVRPLPEGGYAVETVRSGAWSTRRGRRDLCRRAGDLRGRDARHAAAAAPDAKRRHASAHLAAPGRADQDQLRSARGSRGQAAPPQARGLHQGCRDHVVVSSRRVHAHRARPLRQGLQRDGVAGDRHERWRRTDPALAQVARRRSSAIPASFSRTTPGWRIGLSDRRSRS